jgi:hypothetical protein
MYRRLGIKIPTSDQLVSLVMNLIQIYLQFSDSDFHLIAQQVQIICLLPPFPLTNPKRLNFLRRLVFPQSSIAHSPSTDLFCINLHGDFDAQFCCIHIIVQPYFFWNRSNDLEMIFRDKMWQRLKQWKCHNVILFRRFHSCGRGTQIRGIQIRIPRSHHTRRTQSKRGCVLPEVMHAIWPRCLGRNGSIPALQIPFRFLVNALLDHQETGD